MAFRKRDLTTSHKNFAGKGFDFDDPYIYVESELDGLTVKKNVSVRYKTTEELTKESLDPTLITLDSILNEGVTIDPGTVNHLLDITDLSDIESRREQLGENLYKALVDNGYLKVEDNEN